MYYFIVKNKIINWLVFEKKHFTYAYKYIYLCVLDGAIFSDLNNKNRFKLLLLLSVVIIKPQNCIHKNSFIIMIVVNGMVCIIK